MANIGGAVAAITATRTPAKVTPEEAGQNALIFFCCIVGFITFTVLVTVVVACMSER